MMAHVGVILPVYNGEALIRDSVESILTQTFGGFELIVVNDGSTDGTRAKLEEMHTEKLRIINKPNGGIVSALNAGIEATRARYLARLDCGDIALPERLRKQFAFMEEHPEVGILGTGARIRDSHGQTHVRIMPESDAEIRKWFIAVCPFIHPSVMLRMSVLERVGLYDPAQDGSKGRGWEDYDLWTRMLTTSRGHNLGEPLIILRRESASITRSKHWARMMMLRLKARRRAIQAWGLPPTYYGQLLIVAMASLVKTGGLDIRWAHRLIGRTRRGLW